jgi:hypothetical protein
MHNKSVRASQKIHYVSATKPNRLMLFEKQSLFIVRTVRNTQMHCVGRMQSFNVLNLVVYIITTDV